MNKAYILASYRTPGCRANKGKFKHIRPDDLAALAIKGLLERTELDPATVEDVYLGCAFPEAEQGMNVGRVAGMKAGLAGRGCRSDHQPVLLLGPADYRYSGGTGDVRFCRLYCSRWCGVDVLRTSWRAEIQR
jgi:hypothetical protein